LMAGVYQRTRQARPYSADTEQSLSR
jgi:hypothetical protein